MRLSDIVSAILATATGTEPPNRLNTKHQRMELVAKVHDLVLISKHMPHIYRYHGMKSSTILILAEVTLGNDRDWNSRRPFNNFHTNHKWPSNSLFSSSACSRKTDGHAQFENIIHIALQRCNIPWDFGVSQQLPCIRNRTDSNRYWELMSILRHPPHISTRLHHDKKSSVMSSCCICSAQSRQAFPMYQQKG